MTKSNWKNRKAKKRNAIASKREARKKNRRKEKEPLIRQKREEKRKEEADKKAIWKITREGEKMANRLTATYRKPPSDE